MSASVALPEGSFAFFLALDFFGGSASGAGSSVAVAVSGNVSITVSFADSASGTPRPRSSSFPCAFLLWPHHRGEVHQGSTWPGREEDRRDLNASFLRGRDPWELTPTTP